MNLGPEVPSVLMDEELKNLLEAMRQENAAAQAETRRHFDVVAERLETRFGGLAESVGLVDEKLDRTTVVLEERIERGFAETQAMIKFSHHELDRRVRSLENTVADLQARVERLESSAH